MVGNPPDASPPEGKEGSLIKLIATWWKRSRPLNDLFEVTSRCNLSCRHCYQQDTIEEPELDFPRIIDILDQLEAAGVLYLGITGGEPFVRDDIIDILAAAKKRHFFVTLLSNGTMIDEPAARSLGKLGIEMIDLSFYGADAHTNDAVTGVEGSFAAFCRGHSLLKDRGLKVRFKTAVLQANQMKLEDIKQFAAMHEVSLLCDPKVIPRRNGDHSSLGERLDPSEYPDMLWETVWGHVDRSTESVAAMDKIGNPGEPDERGKIKGVCKAGFVSCAIRSSGDVLPCIVLPIVLGDLRKESFESIWNGHKIEQYRELSRNLYPECRTCSLLPICFRCPAHAYLEEGDIMKIPEFACRGAVYSAAYLRRKYHSSRRLPS